MYRVWCEWDIGQEGLVFSTEDSAMQWCEDNYNLQEAYEDCGFMGVRDVISNGLLTIEPLKVV